MVEVRSFAERLDDERRSLASEFEVILDRSRIHNVDPNRHGSGIAYLGYACWGWIDDEALVGERTRLLARVNDWADLLQLLHRDAIPSTRRRLDKCLSHLRRWLEREGNDTSVPSSIERAKAATAQTFESLGELIALGTHGDEAIIAVPDTNSLMRSPDVASFTTSLETEEYLVVMLTTVVSELDGLKDRGRTDEVRSKAAKSLRHLKGLRDRGDVRAGVTVQRKIRLRMEHREVPVQEILTWLDPSVPDDRILGGALDLQAREPSATVILVTTDLNLQNKAAAVGMPFVDPSP